MAGRSGRAQGSPAAARSGRRPGRPPTGSEVALLAYFALFAYPVATLILFARLPRAQAVLVSFFAAYLLLPSKLSYNLPLIPSLTRDTGVAFAAVAACVLFANRGVGREAAAQGWLPRGVFARLLVFTFLLSPVLTVVTNGDRLNIGGTVLQGMRLYDAASMFYGQFAALVPFLLARRYLSTEEGQIATLRAFVIAGLLYSLPILIESRLSPQIHQWVYGYRPFAFGQQIRDGGFRPVVFLHHGLWTAIFVATSVIAAAALWRIAEQRTRGMRLMAALWLTAVLILCKSLGALMLGAALAPLARFAPTRLQALAAGMIGLAVLGYPMLRSAGLVPVDDIRSAVMSISEDRAASLGYRFNNEDILLERANDRALFGWGFFRRNRVFDPMTGLDVSTTDGHWVLVFGIRGWAGYIAEYGLLVMPLLMLWRARVRNAASSAATGIALLLAANLVDTLMNGTMTPLTWLAAGAVFGHLEAAGRESRATATHAAAVGGRTPPRRAAAARLASPGRSGVDGDRREPRISP